MTHMSPGSIGYPLLAAAGAVALAVNSDSDNKLNWMVLANVLNSYAIYKAFNAPYFAAALAIGTIFMPSIFSFGPGKRGPIELAATLHVGGFFLASAKFLDLLTNAS